jgi:hypothetical protein
MWVNLTLGVTPEMAETIEDEAEKHGVSRNKYLRALVREAESSPFDASESDVDLTVDDSEAVEAQKGGA